jgi:caa(3)-type oxidase subunit IV
MSMSTKTTIHAATPPHGATKIRAHDTSAEVRTYLIIFGSLAALTALTVGVAYMNLPHAAGVIVALLIAAVKVFLIAAFFMHLRSEHPLINWSLAICLALVMILVVFVLPDLGIHELEERAREAAATHVGGETAATHAGGGGH